MNSVSLPPPAARTSRMPTVRYRRPPPPPVELEETLGAGIVRRAFEKLSALQQDCYVEWVRDGLTREDRLARAELVSSVARRLASPLVMS